MNVPLCLFSSILQTGMFHFKFSIVEVILRLLFSMILRTRMFHSKFSFAEASTSQTSSREKIRGSPRFPHRIVPANSLNAIAPGSSISRSQRWHSMEDARKTRVAAQLPRGSSCSPSCDVWSTREAATAESDTRPDDSSSRERSEEENDHHEEILSPTDSELKTARSSSSASSSPINIGTSNDESSSGNNSRSESATGVTQPDTSTNFPRERSRSSSPLATTPETDLPEETENRANAPRDD